MNSCRRSASERWALAPGNRSDPNAKLKPNERKSLSRSRPRAPAEHFTAHCDGGSRGNPGPAGYGAVVEDSKGKVVAELSQFLGIQTNNFAEYSGLLGVLKWAVETARSTSPSSPTPN